jgi:hypothetical protein
MPELEAAPPSLLANGGVVAVVLGQNGDLPTDYGYHPKVVPVEGWKLHPHKVDNAIPNNAKAIILGGDRLPRDIFESIMTISKRRRIPYMTRSTLPALEATLRDLLPPKLAGSTASPATTAPEPDGPVDTDAAATRQQAPRGAVRGLIEAHAPELLKEDATMGTMELAKRLFRIAQVQQVSTTVASLSQGIRIWKRENRIGERPASATPERVLVLQRIDRAIAELQGCRGYIEELEKENAELRKKVEHTKQIFSLFKEME